jgi:hypothetical protein
VNEAELDEYRWAVQELNEAIAALSPDGDWEVLYAVFA